MTTASADTSAPTAGIRPADYRLPGQTRVGGVHLQVADLERSLSYYRYVIGLRGIAASAETASLGVPGSNEALVTLHPVPGTRPVPAADQARLLEWTLVVPSPLDADAAGRRLVEAGYPAAPDGRTWRAADPWGTTLRIAAAQ